MTDIRPLATAWNRYTAQADDVTTIHALTERNRALRAQVEALKAERLRLYDERVLHTTAISVLRQIISDPSIEACLNPIQYAGWRRVQQAFEEEIDR